ncbi:MAG: ABC transporter permease subunit [Planctomycetia bacterium]|nr:ABC transporter permease subunit [Planctomycetia bacterium]
MASVLQSGLARVRSGWVRPVSRQSRQERLGTLLLLSLAAVLVWFAGALTRWQLVLGGTALLFLLAVLLRRGWVKLLGPVFFWDVVRTARRGALGLRVLYTGFLWFMLLAAAFFYSLAALDDPWALFTASRVPARELSDIAASYFAVFMAVQFIVALLLTPVGVATAIPEEKRRQTLEFLLATDLRNHEIVFGILAARLASMGLLLLSGLPVLALLQLLGGVEPDLVLIGFGVTALTAASVASLSFLNSVYARRGIHALTTVYLQIVGYLVLTGVADALLHFLPTLCTFPSTETWSSPIVLLDMVDLANTGNLGTAAYQLLQALQGGTRLADALPPILVRFAWFHGTVIVVCVGWSVLRLRGVALHQAAAPALIPEAAQRSWLRLNVGRWPMLWKELFARRQRRSWLAALGRGLLGTLAVLSALAILLAHAAFIPLVDWRDLRLHMNIWTRVGGDVLATLLLLQVGFHAASSICGERDRQTLDTLLTTPLSARDMLFAKWLGSILGARRGWAWLFGVWLFGWYCGGLEAVDLLVLPVATGIFAAGMASLGLWISAVSPTTLAALPRMVLLVVLAWGGQWFYLPALVAFGAPSAVTVDATIDVLAIGLTPPVTLDYLASHTFYGQVEQAAWLGKWEDDLKPIAGGLAWWLVLMVGFGLSALGRFRRDVARGTVPRSAANPEPREVAS